MAGILDAKQRILDSIITQEGKRQLGDGDFKAEYYSFGDSVAIYDLADVFVSGTGNRADRIALPFVLEASMLPQDQITFEASDAGRIFVRELLPVSDSVVRVVDGKIFSGSVATSMETVTKQSQFASITNQILSTSLNNFQKLSVLGSPRIFRNEEEKSFAVDLHSVGFDILDDSPIPSQRNGGMQSVDVNHADSLFADKKFSHMPNFKYLPPVNKVQKQNSPREKIGNWQPINQQPIQTYEQLYKTEIEPAEKTGYSTTVSFVSSSKQNRIFGQMFEVAGNQLTKLDVIDFGSFITRAGESKRVFFAGKVYTDDTGSDTFINMFTLIFS
jgi:hypothetical protein